MVTGRSYGRNSNHSSATSSIDTLTWRTPYSTSVHMVTLLIAHGLTQVLFLLSFAIRFFYFIISIIIIITTVIIIINNYYYFSAHSVWQSKKGPDFWQSEKRNNAGLPKWTNWLSGGLSLSAESICTKVNCVFLSWNVLQVREIRNRG